MRSVCVQAVIDAAAASATGTTLIGSGDTAVSYPATLYPVPVRIVNYRDSGGATPNVNTNVASESNDVLTTRFFLYDSLSGVTTVGSTPEILRYATTMRLTINTRPGGDAHPTLMDVPVLTITYVERLASGISAAGASGAYGKDTLSFRVDYVADNTPYGNAVVALAATLGALILIRAAVSLTAWVRNNARDSFEAALGLPHLLRYLLALVTCAAPTYFWFCWAAAAYWLCFFKLQTQVYALLPAQQPGYSDDAYTTVTAALISVWVLYTVRIGALVAEQVTVDVFFIDWERPRGVLMRAGADHEASLAAAVAKGGGINTAYGGAVQPPASVTAAGTAANTGAAPPTPGAPQPVPVQAPAASVLEAGGAAVTGGPRFPPISVWRTLMAAREWNELSTQRRTSVPLTFIVLVALLQVRAERNGARVPMKEHHSPPSPPTCRALGCSMSRRGTPTRAT